MPSSPSGNRAHEPVPLVIDQLDIVMVLGPVVSHAYHRTLLNGHRYHGSMEETQRSRGLWTTKSS
jgi:hypothetical protein